MLILLFSIVRNVVSVSSVKSLGLLFEGVMVIVIVYFGQFMSLHHSDQISYRSPTESLFKGVL